MEFGFTAKEILDRGLVSKNDLYQIKSWLQKTKFPLIPEQLLLSFLISCDKDQKATQRAILAYFTTKNKAPEIFSNRNIDSPELELCMQVTSMIAIPERTNAGHTVVFFRLEDASYSKFNILSLIRIAAMLLEVHIQKYPSMGLITIIDMNKFSIKLLPKMSIPLLTKLQHYVQEGLPMKIHEVHILNCNLLFHHIMGIFKFCMSKELLSKFKLHYSDMDRNSFFENHVPAKCMPAEYGGELPCLEVLRANVINDIRSISSYFKHEEKMRSYYETS